MTQESMDLCRRVSELIYKPSRGSFTDSSVCSHYVSIVLFAIEGTVPTPDATAAAQHTYANSWCVTFDKQGLSLRLGISSVVEDKQQIS